MKDRVIHLLLAAVCLAAIVSSLALRTVWYDTAEVLPAKSKAADQRLDQAGPLTLYFHEQRPYYMSYQDDVHGLVADNVNLALNSAGITFTWEEIPAARQLDLIRENSSRSCAVGWLKTEARERLGKFTKAVYQGKPHVVVTRPGNQLLTDGISLDSLLNHWQLRLLVKSDHPYAPVLDSVLQGKKIWTIPTTTDNYSMLKMIRNHRADYCFMPEEEVGDLLLFSNLNKADFKIIHITGMPRRNNRYVLCSKKVEDEVIDRMNFAIESTVSRPVN